MEGSSLILDIDEQGIKALIIEETFQGVAIKESCHVFRKDIETSEDFNFFLESLNLISKKIDLKGCSTATLFIPSSFFSFRNTHLPFKSKRKLRQVLDYELAFMLPLNNTKYLSDFILTDISFSDNQNYIFSASIPDYFIENYFNSLDQFGIRPELITIKGYVKSCWFANKENASKILFLDIQGDEKTLTCVINNKVVFVRSLKYSDSEQEFVQAIFNTYLGVKQKSKIDLLLDKIIVTSDQDKDQRINDELLNSLATRFQCRAEYAVVEEDLLSFLLKERKNLLNLCQAQYKQDSLFKENINRIMVTTIIAALAVILFFANIYLEISSLEKELSIYKDAQIEIFRQTFPGQTKIIDPFMQMKAEVSASRKEIKGERSNTLNKKGIRSIDLLYELTDKIPGNVNVIVSRLLFNNNRLIVSGLTDDFNNIDKIKNSLETSEFFQNVDISKATADKKDGKVLFKFTIRL